MKMSVFLPPGHKHLITNGARAKLSSRLSWLPDKMRISLSLGLVLVLTSYKLVYREVDEAVCCVFNVEIFGFSFLSFFGSFR